MRLPFFPIIVLRNHYAELISAPWADIAWSVCDAFI
jgi:hypothetical protein